MPAVSNSRPLIALAAIERLNLLPALFESVLIPPAVAQEIKRSIPVAPVWLNMKALGTALPTVVMRLPLADGEREPIALAIELHADPVILDDLPARRVAEAAGLSLVRSGYCSERSGWHSEESPSRRWKCRPGESKSKIVTNVNGRTATARE